LARWRKLTPFGSSAIKISNFLIANMADSRHLENRIKSRYLDNGFTDRHKFSKVTHIDPLNPHRALNVELFKVNILVDGRHIENRKIAISL